MQDIPEDASKPSDDPLKRLKREWDKKKHLFNEQEMELYNSLNDMVPLSQVIAEIEDDMKRNDPDGE